MVKGRLDNLCVMYYYDDYYDELEHSGVKRESGRYEWGSGEIPYQHEPWFRWGQDIDNLRAQGLTETDIAKYMGMSTNEYRRQTAVYTAERRAAESSFAYRLKQHGYSNVSIAERMHVSEAKVRDMLSGHYMVRTNKLKNIEDVLTDAVDEKGYIDVGDGAEAYLGVKKTQLAAALKIMTDKGYVVDNIYIEQATNSKKNTTIKVLAKPGTTKAELYDNAENLHYIGERLTDDGLERTKLGLMRPQSLDSKRLLVKYNEEGGLAKDGVIELRPGVPDISLGGSHYAQVRIAVDDKYYLKGMAVYNPDMPPGVDVIFNSNKHKGAPPEKVFKELKKKDDGEIDWDNPFGSSIKESRKNEDGLLIGGQREYIGADGQKHLSVINKVNDEGDWGEWKKTIASQVLSKQPVSVAKRQLTLAYLSKKSEFDDIMRIENPEVKKNLLSAFADDCDSAAVDLKATALPRQSSRVILPLISIKDNEIFAPSYKDGETVVLIRYPHGGRFEIPELTVNNKNKEGRQVMGLDAKDAVGISGKTAAKLSGADFDGDTVLVIPNNDGALKTAPSLKGLKDFDPKEAYPGYPGMKKFTVQDRQREMGNVTNLITDMTIRGASAEELAKAVRHSMVVVDAYKHQLNHKQSEIDNQIAMLKEKYQGGAKAGASTLISRASSEFRDDERYDRYHIDQETGRRIFTKTGREYQRVQRYTQDSKKLGPDGTPLHKKGDVRYDENGNAVKKTYKYQTVTTKMDATEDAMTLSSGTAIETIYGQYANSMKMLGNTARKALLGVETFKRDARAALTYSSEVASLESKLNLATMNRPKERKAQIIASKIIAEKKKANPELALKENAGALKKVSQGAINYARIRMGTTSRKEREINITPKEWEAIENHAITPTKLREILGLANMDTVRNYCMPYKTQKMTTSQIAYANALLRSGNSIGDIADQLGVSPDLVSKYLNRE